MRTGIATRTALILLICFILITAVASRLVRGIIIETYVDERSRTMQSLASTIDETITDIPIESFDSFHSRLLDQLASQISGRIFISDLNGKIVYDSKRLRLGLSLQLNEEIKVTKKDTARKFLLRTTENLKPYYYPPSQLRGLLSSSGDLSLVLFAPVSDEAGELIGQLIVIDPFNPADLGRYLSLVTLRLISIMSAFLLLAGVLIYSHLMRNVVRPIRKLIKTLETIEPGTRAEPVSVAATPEIVTLSRNMNSFLEDYEDHETNLKEQIKELNQIVEGLESRNNELNKKQKLINFDLQLAHNIQQELLPQVYPRIEGLVISAVNFQFGEIGGDCFDFYKLDDFRIGAFIGDVSGKGISAAIVMSMVTVLFGQLKERLDSPAQVLSKVNEIMFRHFGEQHSIYLTCFYFNVDTRNMTLTFSCAGHNPPILYRKSTGEIIPLEAEGFGLGMFQKVTYEEKKIDVLPGDMIVLYTDGVVDTRDPEGKMFGNERLVETIKQYPTANSFRLTHNIVEDLEEFASGAKRPDDLTLIIIEIDNRVAT